MSRFVLTFFRSPVWVVEVRVQECLDPVLEQVSEIGMRNVSSIQIGMKQQRWHYRERLYNAVQLVVDTKHAGIPSAFEKLGRDGWIPASFQ